MLKERRERSRERERDTWKREKLGERKDTRKRRERERETCGKSDLEKNSQT